MGSGGAYVLKLFPTNNNNNNNRQHYMTCRPTLAGAKKEDENPERADIARAETKHTMEPQQKEHLRTSAVIATIKQHQQQH